MNRRIELDRLRRKVDDLKASLAFQEQIWEAEWNSILSPWERFKWYLSSEQRNRRKVHIQALHDAEDRYLIIKEGA